MYPFSYIDYNHLKMDKPDSQPPAQTGTSWLDKATLEALASSAEDVSVDVDRLLDRVDASLSDRTRLRLHSLNIGHKLRIIKDYRQGLDVAKLCKKHRISQGALALLLHDDVLMEMTDNDAVETTKKFMANGFYQVANMALLRITPEKLDRLNGYQLSMVAAITLDKARLIEGQPTENLAFKNLAISINTNLSELREYKERLLERMKAKLVEAEVVKPAATQAA